MMRYGLIGRKLGMTRKFTEQGLSIPVTAVRLGPCVVVGKRSMPRDGYDALQLGFEPIPEKRVSRPQRGQFRASQQGPFRVLREFRVEPGNDVAVGAKLSVNDVFKVGERVDVQGTSKGRGYAGVIRRWGFGGFPGSHGTHEYFRHGGSIGNRSFPGRVFKGKHMAGQYGAKVVTTQNLEVVEICPEEHLALILGAVPGSRNGIVVVAKAGKGSI